MLKVVQLYSFIKIYISIIILANGECLKKYLNSINYFILFKKDDGSWPNSCNLFKFIFI